MKVQLTLCLLFIFGFGFSSLMVRYNPMGISPVVVISFLYRLPYEPSHMSSVVSGIWSQKKFYSFDLFKVLGI